MHTPATTLHFREITKEKPFKICFVCLGNICRSPTAEGILQHLIREKGLESFFEIDSAGISAYHIGERPNSKSRDIARQYGVELLSRARQFEAFDLSYFDLILAMDEENYYDILSLDQNHSYRAKVTMLRSFDPKPGNGNVPDPYYGGLDGFELVFKVIRRSCLALIEKLEPFISM